MGSHSFLDRPAVRAITLVDLIDHQVPEHDREWWARCKLNHTAVFPYLHYDFVRLMIGLLIYRLFMPLWAIGAVALFGFAIVARQYVIERRIEANRHSAIESYRAFRQLIVIRAITWSAISFAALSFAPIDWMLTLAIGGMLIMFIDAMCMIATPKRAIAAAVLMATAMVVPLVLRGMPQAYVGAVMIAAALLFIHWGVFNLHYMFATRRLRTKNLREANETIQLLLNQYDEDGSDWLFECDRQGKILRPNERFCRAAKRRVEHLEGLRLSLLFEDCTAREKLRAIGEREEAFRGLVIPLRLDGQEHWWSLSGRPVYDRKKRLSGWRGFIADVTEVHATRKRLDWLRADYEANAA